MNGPNCVEAQFCRGDFYLMLRAALKECGGNPQMIGRLQEMKLKDVVNLLAQNGIRMVYLDHKHIHSTEI